MRFALVDNNKVEAKSGILATCPGCSETVIPKCGDQRVHHWAHSRNKMCDSWWEPETEWHRNWKSKFPKEWQEDFLRDDVTGEKHIADIRTDKGLVIEFQHSHIKPEERYSREAFYKNLTWVVDGSRLKRDYPRFMKGKKCSKYVKKGIFGVVNPKEYFPSEWLESTVPVLFDFQNNSTLSDIDNKQHILYCLSPGKIGRDKIVAEMTSQAFVNNVISGEWITRTRQLINDITQVDKERREQLEGQKRLQQNIMVQNFVRVNTRGRGRRF